MFRGKSHTPYRSKVLLKPVKMVCEQMLLKVLGKLVQVQLVAGDKDVDQVANVSVLRLYRCAVYVPEFDIGSF
jgi:hypothetical protein